MIDEKDLPEGWKVFTLGKVCKLKNGYAFKSTDYVSDGVPVIRISDIKEGIVTSKKSVKVYPNGEYQNYLIENNDILVAMSGATTGKFGIFKSNEIAYQNQRVGKFQILDSKVLNNEFLLYQLHSLKRQIEKDAYGGAQPNISSTKIEQMEIVVPPLNHQLAIVAKIEELFSELDKGIENLKTAQQQLKVYRQAVLKWAFEGKLTNDDVKDGEFPEGWSWVKLIELGQLGRGKSKHRPRNEKSLFGGKYPFIQTGEVKAAGHIIKSYSQTYSEKGLAQSKLWKKGTLCITIAANIAETAFLGFDGCFPDSIVGFTPDERIVNPEYIYYFFKGNQSRLESFAPATAQKNINLNTLENLIIPYCSVEDQNAIVQEIESRLSVCDNMEETINNGLLQAESLRQSILKKAFEGDLVKTKKR